MLGWDGHRLCIVKEKITELENIVTKSIQSETESKETK